jgi:hypothetical protein
MLSGPAAEFSLPRASSEAFVADLPGDLVEGNPLASYQLSYKPRLEPCNQGNPLDAI